MRQDVKDISLKIDAAIQLCKNVLELGEKIRELSPIDIGMETYAEKLVQHTESRGHATRIAIQELNAINASCEAIENDSTALFADKAFLSEKMQSVRDLSVQFSKQNTAIRRNIEIHLKSLHKESAEFKHNVGVIKNYLKAPDKRTFYG